MNKLFCKTKNGHLIYYDNETSHASTHFNKNVQLEAATKEALEKCDIEGDKMRFTVDTGRILGKSDLVETDDGDEIIYAKRPLHDVSSRFVKNKSAQDTPLITIDVRRVDDNSYNLYTSYIGQLVPSFPGGSNETPESIPFWNTHALVYGNQEIVPGTETLVCPWNN